LNRVEKLAKRRRSGKGKNAKPFYYVVPLKEILSEVLGKGVNTKVVNDEYFKLINKFGSELDITLEVPIASLKIYSYLIAEAISRVRSGDVNISPGYDGVYGKIRIFKEGEREAFERTPQMDLL
jgi:PHP family Zn ribbon phosphoesterase